jgi:3-phenylpropionate/cinnamic acid dioxygenase small subunit
MQALHDKLEIQELLARYARGVDTKDWELLRTVFTPDATIDFGRSSEDSAGPRDKVIAWLERSLTPMPMMQHIITNVEVDLDGDRATVRAYFFNPMRLPGTTEESFCGGRYHHEVVRTPEGWKSERLSEEMAWFVNPPAGAGD